MSLFASLCIFLLYKYNSLNAWSHWIGHLFSHKKILMLVRFRIELSFSRHICYTIGLLHQYPFNHWKTNFRSIYFVVMRTIKKRTTSMYWFKCTRGYSGKSGNFHFVDTWREPVAAVTLYMHFTNIIIKAERRACLF